MRATGPDSPLFPERAKLFLSSSDAPSYVCSTLFRLIKHFMLTCHFLQTGWLLWHFSSIFLVGRGTLGQKLAGKRFLGNLQGLLQKLSLYHVKTPGRGGHGRIKTIHFRLYRLTRTRRYQERMRVSICIAPPAVDNTICRRSAAQLRICFNSISWIF